MTKERRMTHLSLTLYMYIIVGLNIHVHTRHALPYHYSAHFFRRVTSITANKTCAYSDRLWQNWAHPEIFGWDGVSWKGTVLQWYPQWFGTPPTSVAISEQRWTHEHSKRLSATCTSTCTWWWWGEKRRERGREGWREKEREREFLLGVMEDITVKQKPN